MTPEVAVALIAMSGVTVAAVIGGLFSLFRSLTIQKRNGNGKTFDPVRMRSGDMSTAFWETFYEVRFSRLERQLELLNQTMASGLTKSAEALHEMAKHAREQGEKL